MDKRQLHIFKIWIKGYGSEECAFCAFDRKKAFILFCDWLKTEPHVSKRQ